MSCSNGVLDSLTSDFVYKRKAGQPLFILHPCAVLQVFDPVLKQNREHNITDKQPNNCGRRRIKHENLSTVVSQLVSEKIQT